MAVSRYPIGMSRDIDATTLRTIQALTAHYSEVASFRASKKKCVENKELFGFVW
jgi:hypothetical protein